MKEHNKEKGSKKKSEERRQRDGGKEDWLTVQSGSVAVGLGGCGGHGWVR